MAEWEWRITDRRIRKGVSVEPLQGSSATVYGDIAASDDAAPITEIDLLAEGVPLTDRDTIETAYRESKGTVMTLTLNTGASVSGIAMDWSESEFAKGNDRVSIRITLTEGSESDFVWV